MKIKVFVTPRASANQIIPMENAREYKVRLNAPPVDGKANEALVACLAERLGIPKRDVTIASGQSSRQKIIELPEGVDLSLLAAKPRR